MPKHILADTSCLILLEKINRLDWLRALYGKLIVAEEVATEYGMPLPDWIEVRSINNQPFLASLLAESLGKGEAASLALAFEVENPLLILDDQKARKKARSFNFLITGTSGILLLAKKRGLCVSIKPELDALVKAGMWLAPSLYDTLLSLSGESK